MKKKNRSARLLLLLLVLVLAVCAVFIAKKINEKREKEEEEALATSTEDDFSVYETDGLQKISYKTSAGYEAAFEKEDGTWYVAGDHDFPVDQYMVKDIENAVREIRSAKSYQDLGDDVTGFSEPKYTLELTDAKGTVTLTAGKETKVHGTYYTSSGDGNVYLTDKTIYANCDHALADYMKYDEVPTFVKGKLLEVIMPDRTTSQDLTDTENFDTYTFELLLEELQNIEFCACVTYRLSKEDASQYGLDEPSMKIRLNYGTTGAQNFVFEFGDLTDESGTYRFGRIQGSEHVYIVYNAFYEDFTYEIVDGSPVYETAEESEDVSETAESGESGETEVAEVIEEDETSEASGETEETSGDE